MSYKNLSYTISHFFVMLFMYVFVSHRYSKPKTFTICAASFLAITVPNVLKLNIYPDSRLCYFLVTIYQIAMTQLTGLLISKRRDSKTLFVGLSGSNYVVAGSIMAAILHICTGNLYLCIAGCIVTHVAILLVLYTKIRDICLKYQEETMQSWWKLCLIPVFFYCGFSCFTFFPYTLDDHPENMLGVVMFIITMFVSYVVVLRYMSTESQRTDLYWQNKVFEAYIKNMENQSYLVEQSEKNLRILRHDMRHYTGMIDSLLEQGEYQEIKKVTKYINTVADGNKVVKYCSNLIVNTMLSCMMERASSLDVEVRHDIIVAEEIPVNSYEFAMVVANLFENAINCVKGLTQNRKLVDVKIRCEADYLLVYLKNKYENEIYFEEGASLPKSRKGKNHGLGMQSVKAFSDKIGGSIGCYCEDGMFHITLFAKF